MTHRPTLTLMTRQDCDCPCLSCAIGVHGYCGVCEDDYLWLDM